MALAGVDTMWFLPSALNVNVKKFKQARVNGGSNYDSLKVAKCTVPIYYLAKPQPRERAWKH